MWEALSTQIRECHDRVALGWFLIAMYAMTIGLILSLIALAVWGMHYGQ